MEAVESTQTTIEQPVAGGGELGVGQTFEGEDEVVGGNSAIKRCAIGIVAKAGIGGEAGCRIEVEEVVETIAGERGQRLRYARYQAIGPRLVVVLQQRLIDERPFRGARL